MASRSRAHRTGPRRGTERVIERAHVTTQARRTRCSRGIVLALALIGVLTVTRGTPVGTVVTLSDSGPPPVTDSLFERSFELFTGTHIFSGNTVEPALNGRRSIRDCGRTFAQRSRRSPCRCTTRCRERWPTRMAADPQRAGARRTCACCFSSTRSARSTCRKSWLDSLRARRRRSGAAATSCTGTRSTTRAIDHTCASWWSTDASATPADSVSPTTGLGDGHHDDQWRESNVRFEGPSVMQLQAAFAAAWAECDRRADHRAALLSQRPAFTQIGRDARAACSTRRRPPAARRPSGSSRCRSAVRERRSTSRTRTSSPTTTSVAARAARVKRGVDVRDPHGEREDRREDDVVGRAAIATRNCCAAASGSTNTSRRCCTRRRSSSTACGARSAR